MKVGLFVVLALVVLLAGAGFWWRRAVRHRLLPHPSWLSWLLENPYMEAVTGSALILRRVDLAVGMRVLDVGCGAGRLTIPAAKKVGPRGRVVALDIQMKMLDKMKKRAEASGLTNIETVLGGIGQGVLKCDSFDLAFLVTVLGEVPDREAALGEIYTALKPGGIVSITEAIPDPHYQSRDSVYSLAQAAGFRPLHYHGNWLTFTVNFVKPEANARDNEASFSLGDGK